MAKKLRKFTIQSWVSVLVGVSINAESFEDAVAQAKKLDVDDYVNVKGEYSDGRTPAINWITDDTVEPPQ